MDAWMTSYATLSRVVLCETRYDGFISRGPNAELLNSVVSSIITKGGEIRPNSAESFILRNTSWSDDVDISNFFSRYHFPKLQRLRLLGCSISSWNLLESRAASLTTLSLTSIRQSPLPTLPQILSILSANPNLQSLELSYGSIPHADSDRSSPQVQLCCLKTLDLRGIPRRVFGLLNRLELPDKLDDLTLILSGNPLSDLPQTLGPYLGDYIRRRSPDRLRLSVGHHLDCFYISVGDAYEGDSTRANWFTKVEGHQDVTLGEEEAHRLCFDTIAHIPQETIATVTTALPILRSEELCIGMCNLAHLQLEGINVSTWFVEPEIHEPHDLKDLLRGLRSISISEPSLGGGDWSPLTNFLARRAAVGNRIHSLRVSCHPPMGDAVVKGIMRMVDILQERF
jgi:hypothetical protein